MMIGGVHGLWCIDDVLWLCLCDVRKTYAQEMAGRENLAMNMAGILFGDEYGENGGTMAGNPNRHSFELDHDRRRPSAAGDR
jgi:hypothetical protein